MNVLFSHEKPRRYQDELINDVAEAVSGKSHLLAHAPTGIGKTAAVIGPSLSWALENKGTVFFLTPKISQHSIAVDELRKIKDKHGVLFRAVDMIGRKYACVDDTLHNLDVEEFYEICRRRRKEEKCQYYKNAVGFNKEEKEATKLYFDKLMRDYPGIDYASNLVDMCKNFVYAGEETPLCAYEIMTKMASQSTVVIADYFHLLSPSIRQVFLDRTKKKLSKSIVIIDEAHNVPDRVRSHLSISITHLLVNKAEKELRVMGVKDLQKQVVRLKRAMNEILEKKLKDKKEVLILKEDLPDIDHEEFKSVGLAYLEASNRTKSACVKLAKFFSLWEQDLSSYLRMARKWKSGGMTISYKNLDPSLATSDLIKEARSVIAMSGTLTPLEMYRDLLGFEKDRTMLRIYKSPFPKKNRLNLIYTGVTTKYSQRTRENFARLADLVTRVVNAVPGNVAVFLPSYDVMNSILAMVKMNKPVFVQKENNSPSDLMRMLSEFRNMKSSGAVLFAVAGGSLSEGIDYPGRDLLAVLVVGIPLNEYDLETKALIDYYEYKFGAGWTYGYLYPAMARAIQAAGRLIRNPDDIGVVVFMDERYTWKNYSRCFPPDLEFKVSISPELDVRRFFERLD